MKTYIKPLSETIELQAEDRILSASPVTLNEEMGDGVWRAPKRSIWTEE